MSYPLGILRVGMFLLSLSVLGQSSGVPTLASARQTVPTARTSGPAGPEMRPLRTVLQELKKRYQVDILFEGGLVDRITVPANVIDYNDNLEHNLDRLLQISRLRYKKAKNGGYVIMAKDQVGKDESSSIQTPFALSVAHARTENESQEPQFSLPFSTKQAPEISTEQVVQGTVADEKDEGLPGVSIIIKGSQKGTTTDAGGHFRLEVENPSAILIFSYVGYVPQEVAVGNRATLNITLKADDKTLDEIVVVGYGSVKKKDLTGSVGSIDNKEIKDLGVTRLDQALAGRVAGVQVKAVSGEPGAAPQIRVRGIGSISAGAGPLYVVDGFPTDNIQSLNPNDIASMDILKDASATAIYGSRGANGVIIINTKRGKAGRAILTFDTFYGFQQSLKTPKYMNARDQAQYYYDGIVNRNIDAGNSMTGDPTTWKVPVPTDVVDVLSGKNTTDYVPLDYVLRTAPQQKYQLGASGGSENVKYAVSAEYLNQDGIVINTNFKRYSVRANIDAQVSRRLAVKVNLNPSFSDANVVTSVGASGGANEGVIAQATNVQPYYPMFNPDGSYFIFSPGMSAGPTAYNPVALAREVMNRQKRIGLLGNISAEYTILNNLKFNVMAGTSLQSTQGLKFFPNLPVFLSNPAVGTDNSTMTYNWLTEYTLNYNKTFNKHQITALAGYTVQKERGTSSFLTSNNYPNNLVPTLSATSGIITNGSSDVYEWSLVSYLARLNYNYNSKYYLTASIRTDGSSRFGSNHKYGVFPSTALAWRISDETFMKDIRYVSELKLRASYGKTGNNSIGNYEHFATINYLKYDLGGAAISGFGPAKLANPDLTWEKQQSFNIGLDAAFFNHRLSVNIDHFRSRNTDLLLNVNVAGITGFSNSLQNIGEVKNTGWEFVVSTINVDKKFHWSTDLNLSTYQNRVVKLGPNGDPIYVDGNVTMIGQPIGMFYGWLTDGIFLNKSEIDRGPIFAPGAVTQSRPGDVRFVDLSGPSGKKDGVIDNYDKTIMGSPYPNFYYGMTNRFSYKNLSLSISLQGSQGNQVLSKAKAGGAASLRGRIPAFAYLNNYWKSESDIGDGQTPRPNDQPTGNARGNYSQRQLDYGSYMRINNVTLSYVLPTKLIETLKLSSLRVYLNATNPFLFTKNINFNPDVSTSDNALTPGIDNNDYPLPKSLILGVSIGF
jgi:TonB-linked SusC/RagA family outer membrane protein